jgi:response regulator RpfG family c-di-GMP phosphodiesterase
MGVMGEQSKKTVLIVDDDKANIIALTHILSADYTIYAAKNGRDCIKLALKYLPDIILLDIVMPKMNGYETIAELRKSEKTKAIPVIFITGLNDSDNEEKGLALGASDYITKPFSRDVVKLRVHNHIRTKQISRESKVAADSQQLQGHADLEQASLEKTNLEKAVDMKGLFEKLEPLLLSHDSECLTLLEQIRQIPGTEELARQIEDFEFGQAVITLKSLKMNFINTQN